LQPQTVSRGSIAPRGFATAFYVLRLISLPGFVLNVCNFLQCSSLFIFLANYQAQHISEHLHFKSIFCFRGILTQIRMCSVCSKLGTVSLLGPVRVQYGRCCLSTRSLGEYRLRRKGRVKEMGFQLLKEKIG